MRKAVSESRICISAALLKEYRDVPTALASQGKITAEQFNTLIAGIAAKDLLSLKNLPFPLTILTPKEYVQQARQ